MVSVLFVISAMKNKVSWGKETKKQDEINQTRRKIEVNRKQEKVKRTSEELGAEWPTRWSKVEEKKLQHNVYKVNPEMGGKWLYSCYFVASRCCFQNLFNIAHSILVQLLSSFLSMRLVSVYVAYPYSSMDMTAAWKKLCFILSDRSDFHMTHNLSTADHASISWWLMSISVDQMPLLKSMNLSTCFKEPRIKEEMSIVWFWLEYMSSVLSALTWRPIPLTAFSRLCSWDSAKMGAFARSAMSSV